jgi:peptide/nickel transport system ATP-binding protein
MPSSAELPNPYAPPRGCRFEQRCPRAMPVCRETPPALSELSGGHVVACHLYDDIALRPSSASKTWPIHEVTETTISRSI